ncbi:MAG: hypothetical protein F6K40_08305 [Okeania sp. SIO3I5]|uniref:hypothetical protein n=1 Tax=Okeania sp. SIO3I5 TaxID=2607805 RepID=UPI0013B914F1|nr:hypothetical protein [Okeania sp. SIO3I5]NEQ36283.1 hypothetical protein [Okeania sp. SIO3I5]
MLVLIASKYDKTARSFVEHSATDGVTLLTPENLSVVGWRHHLGNTQNSTAVLGGKIIEVAQITGVLTRLPVVFPEELFHIVPDDRSYVAAEMTAFLVFWLNTLKCRMLNKPTPTCLLGSNWRLPQWIYAAAQVGMFVRPLHQHIALGKENLPERTPENSVTVTVVGKRCIGEVNPTLATQARYLADAAGVDLLSVQFSKADADAEFIDANLWADISQPAIATAILEYFD